MDQLWVLDAGRPSTPSGSGVLSSHGGVKLMGINLSTNTVFTTIVFPTTVAYPDSVSLSPPSYHPCLPTYSVLIPLLTNRISTTSASISAPVSRLQAKASHTSPTPAPKAAMASSSSTSVPEPPGAI